MITKNDTHKAYFAVAATIMKNILNNYNEHSILRRVQRKTKKARK